MYTKATTKTTRVIAKKLRRDINGIKQTKTSSQKKAERGKQTMGGKNRKQIARLGLKPIISIITLNVNHLTPWLNTKILLFN